MRWLKNISREICGLFVDDYVLAVAIILWLVFVWRLLPYLSVAATWRGVILFLGLAILLLGSVLLRVRKH